MNDDPTLGIIIVDHGSRRRESNEMLLRIVAMFQQQTNYSIVEPAHMELATPTIRDAYRRCVERGAKLIVIHPYFLLPGRHWDEDIPRLANEASREFPDVRYLVTAPLGLHPLMAKVVLSRIEQCLAHANGEQDACELCQGTGHCQFHLGDLHAANANNH